MAKFYTPDLQKYEYQKAVINRTTLSPPGLPVSGDRYLIDGTGSGAWAGEDGNIATYDGAAWIFAIKREGMLVWVKDVDKYYLYDGSAWDGTKIHSHSNKALLDSYTQTEANLADAVSKKHTANADTDLDATFKATLEQIVNKSTNVATDGASDTKYPSVKAVKTYADSLVVGLLDDRGSYDASVNTFPAAGGSGTAGAILKGDIWFISVAGTLGGAAVNIGDSARALVDSPGQTATNWSILESNIGYVPENVANKDTDGTLAANSDTKYPSQKAVKTYIDAKAHDKNKDTYLDQGGANEVTAAQAKEAYTKRAVVNTALEVIEFEI